MADNALNPIIDADMDALFILPLHIIPFKTEALDRAKLIKNSHLEGVLELFSERSTGSGQVRIDDLPDHFRWKEGLAHPDQKIMTKLGPLPSYDVYSLRRSLRQFGIPVNDFEELKLSEKKNKQLTGYMSQFTMPLIKQIYGADDMEITSFEDLVRLFKDPDVKKALAKLKMMAEKLKIQVDQIPRFLEDYGDIFLSLSYYKNCLDRIQPLLDSYLAASKEIKKNYQVRQDQNLMDTMARIEKLLTGLVQFLERLFSDFARQTRNMWDELSAEKFEQVKAMIANYHTTIGGVLCGLTVKMNAWVDRFPNPKAGSPVTKGEFIMTDIRQGMSSIRAMASGRMEAA